MRKGRSGVERPRLCADASPVKGRAGIAVVVALALAGVDQLVDAVAGSDPSTAHMRSVGWVAASLALLVVAAVLVRLPSRLLAFGAGVFAGGLLGNVVSAGVHGRAVPNPFVAGEVAFNLADVCVLAGIVLVIVASMRLARRYRHLLPRHTIPVRIVRYALQRYR